MRSAADGLRKGRVSRRGIVPPAGMVLTAMGLMASPVLADNSRGDGRALERCEALTRAAVDHGKVLAAKVVAGGFEASRRAAAVGVPGFRLPESCRVGLVLTPAADSRIETEVWLPTESWNGRLQGIGNGGYAGSIETLEMSVALESHYAVTSTDTGHEGRDYDASWASGHPEKVIDYSWRAIHLTAVAANRLIRAFYGRPARYAYFVGGSNGGRQALIEAERFPQDYNGIVAVAPFLDPANSFATDAWIERQLLENPAGFIPQPKASMITEAVMKSCDRLDGVADGVLEDPRVCHFDPAVLRCGRADRQSCLTAPQVQWLKDIYAGPGGAYKGIRNRGFEPGGEEGWTPLWLGKAPADTLMRSLPLLFYRYFVYDDVTWNLTRFSFERERATGAAHVGGAKFQADDPDLSRFRARGGKLILLQGWSDPAVQPRLVIDYFKRVQARMGVATTAGFIRLYMAPGMAHVVGGPGPNVVGQLAPDTAADARHNINLAVQQWVERGVAPTFLVAGKYTNDFGPLLDPDRFPALRERPLCPYPQVARWSGRGSTDVAANFACGAGRP